MPSENPIKRPVDASLPSFDSRAISDPPASTGENPRVLIVHENQDAREYLKHLLSRHSLSSQWQVETAVHGKEALTLTTLYHPDLILGDVMALEVEGEQFGLLRQIRGHEFFKSLAVVVLATEDHEETALKALMAGADDYVTKPYSDHALLIRLRARIELARLRRTPNSQIIVQKRQAEEVLENIDMVYAVDENFHFTYLNRKAEEAWGRRREDLLGKHYWTEFPQAVDSESYRMHLKTMNERQPIHYETISPLLHRWVDVRIYPSTAGGLAVYFYDIDEHKRRELNAAFLAEIDADFARLSGVNEILDAISDKILRYFGLSRLTYNRVDVRADRIAAFYERRDPGMISGLNDVRLSDFANQTYVEDLVAGQLIAINDIETDPRTAALAESYRPFEVRSQILAPHVMEGELRFVLAVLRRESSVWRPDELEVMRELTARVYLWLERTHVEQALQKSEERYRSLFDSIDEGFCIVEVLFDENDAPVDYLFLATNPAFVDQTGLESAVGRRMRELKPYHEDHWFETYGRVVRTGKPERFVGEAKQLNGRWYDTYAFPHGEGHVGVLFHDITERRQADKAMRDNEQRFRRAFEIDTVGIIFFRTDGAVTEVNDAFLRMSGYNREDVEADLVRWDIMTPPEWMPASLIAVDEFTRTGITTPYEKEYFRKDGSRWWALFAAKRVSEEEGIEFIIDITQRKQVEITLRETEERMRLILDSARDYSIFATDTEGKLISWNTGAERIFGYNEAEALGRHERLIYTRQDRIDAIPEREMQKALKQGYSVNERWHVRKDGRLIYGSGMVRPLRDGNGALRGFTKVMRDETERKQAEQRINVLQQLAVELSARLTAQDMGKSILQVCRETLAASQVSLFLFNPEENSLERFSKESVPSDDNQLRYQRFSLDMPIPLTDAIRSNEIVWGGSQANYIQRYPHLQNDIILNNVHAFIALPLVLDAQILGAIAIAFSQPKDLSREEHEFLIAMGHLCAQALDRAHLYEIEKEARETAEKANHLKMQFLGMISHELRTPLASIKGYATTLLATDVTFSPENQQRFLTIIDQEADKLTDLVVQLLDLTRLQAGTLRIELKAHALQDALEVAKTQLQILAARHQLVVSLPHNLPRVMTDPQRLAQVFTNLVGNSAKFSPQGAAITIRALQEGDVIRVDVSDEGVGILPQHRQDVFEAFRQVDRLTVHHDPGAGLGLAICKGVIEAHGGQIWVQDRDEGTTISFTLRVAPKEPETHLKDLVS